ncbi:hypothetical protein [Stenotrophomonas sp.]|uniref:hypothetical protein n=1 Tax=Stenotrophomonas sp. TaxID=69392 RepID=UPI0031D9BF5B
MSEPTSTFRVDPSPKAATGNAATAVDVRIREQIQAGLDAANAGHLMSAADVEARFTARRAATKRRLEALK